MTKSKYRPSPFIHLVAGRPRTPKKIIENRPTKAQIPSALLLSNV